MPPRKGATNGAASTEMPTDSDASMADVMTATPEMSAAALLPDNPAAEPAQVVRADRVELRQAAVRSAEALEMTITQGAAGIARAERVNLVQGALGVAVADSVEVRQSIVQTVLARGPVRIEQGMARAVVAQQVEIGERGFAGLVIARDVRGGRVLLDRRGGLALGAVLAAAWALLRGRRR